MYITNHKERFSFAYIRAVAASLGFDVYKQEVDDQSVDLGISTGIQGNVSCPRLEMQVKCVTAAPGADRIVFDLEKKNYEDLRRKTQVPRILVIVTIPKNIEDWTEHNEDGLTLRRCAYWVSLLGSPESKNRSSVRVFAPRQQVFSPSTLQSLMDIIASGGKP